MSTKSQGFCEDVSLRAGMHVSGGNLGLLPTADPMNGDAAGIAAWAVRGMGLFAIDSSSPEFVDLEVCAAILDDNSAATDFVIGDRRFASKSSDMTTAFGPGPATCPRHSLRSRSRAAISWGPTIMTGSRRPTAAISHGCGT
jgi:hypothetical protein